MARQVVILHGWSDTPESFRPLARFLTENGFEAVPIWLGRYISMSDHVMIEDVAKRVEAVLNGPDRPPQLSSSFDMIVHSTGGLVARKWISAYHPQGRTCPVKRLLMLAPANFGSKLATTGKSAIGRVFKGWKHGFETGTEMLTALELASDFQWRLAQQDLFVPEGASAQAAPSPYGAGKVWPFVIVGSHPYLTGFRRVVNEDGSDGTVRVAAANLNVHGVTIDLGKREDDAGFTTRWQRRHQAELTFKPDGRPNAFFPFAVVPDRDHASITDPAAESVPYEAAAAAKLPALVLEALRCEADADYRAIAGGWHNLSNRTAELGRPDGAPRRRDRFPSHYRRLKEEYFHQYYQVVLRVVDDHDTEIDDYYIEFFGGDRRRNRAAVYFHQEVLEDVHPQASVATRCFFVDRTDLMKPVNGFYAKIPAGRPKLLNATVAVDNPGEHVTYFGAAGTVTLGFHGRATDGRFLRRNCTHFIKIIVPRIPKQRVFQISPF